MKTYPPLPDLFLDNIPLIPWAFECCEIIGMAMSICFFFIIIFHKFRYKYLYKILHKKKFFLFRIVILRRMLSIIGTVFLLRCVTMLITSLSVPGIHLECTARVLIF